MRLYYLATKERTAAINHSWHALDLGNGKHLVCIDWKDEMSEMQWASHPDVIALPHPILESTVRLTDEHVKHLTGRYPIEVGHNVHHVIKHASNDDPWMRLHVL